MIINTESIVSISEVNQNFSKVARLIEERGSVVVLKNNVPKYIIMDLMQAEQLVEALDKSDDTKR